MSAAKTWPMTSDVQAVIPAYPLKISIRTIARALKTGGDRDHALMNRVRRRLKEACKQGSVIKQKRFGNAVYWRPVETIEVNKVSPKESTGTHSTDGQTMQTELLRFAEFLVSKNKATNQGQMQPGFAKEILRVLMFALNYDQGQQFTEPQVQKLLNLYAEAK